MDNNIKYTIDLEVAGEKNVEQAQQSVKAVGSAVADIASLLSPLNKIVELLQGLTSKMDNFGNVVGENFAVVNKKIDEAQKNLGDLGDKADQEAKKVKKSFLDELGGNFFNFNNIVSGVQNVVSTVAPIFKEGMAREKSEVTFGTLLGSKEEGKKYATELRNTTMATLYGTDTVNQAAQSMLSFGLDSGKTQKALTAIGDIAAGDAQKFGSLSLAFAQISSAGKLGGQDLMQLINAGFNPLAEMSKKTGKSIGQLKDEMSKGAISAQDVEDAFISATSEGGQFAGMLETIKNDTLSGKLKVMQSGFDDLKAKIFEAVVPLVNKLLPVITDNLVPAINSIVEVLTPIFSLIADNLDTIAVFAGVILSVVGAMKLWAGIQTVINFLMTANPISLVVVAIAALIALVYKMIKAWDEWGAAISLFLGPLGLVINFIKTIYDYWDSIIEAFKNDGIIAGLKRIGVAILDILLKPVQQLLSWIGEITDWDWAKSAGDSVEEFRKNIGALEVSSTSTSQESNGEGSAMQQMVGAVNANTSGVADLQNATNTGTSAVSSGGTRNTSINITLGNMVENINFNGSVDDNSENLTSRLQDVFVRVLATATSTL